MFPKSNAGTLRRKNANPTTTGLANTWGKIAARAPSPNVSGGPVETLKFRAQQNSGKNIMNIYIYYVMRVCIYIHIIYIYICIICIVTQQRPKTNDRKTRQLPSQQNSWSMNFPVPLLPIRRPAALFRRGYLPKTRIHGIWMGLRYTCYPLVILT